MKGAKAVRNDVLRHVELNYMDFLEALQSQIDEAVSNGKTSISFKDDLLDCIILYLRSLGYTVSHPIMGEYTVTISWELANPSNLS